MKAGQSKLELVTKREDPQEMSVIGQLLIITGSAKRALTQTVPGPSATIRYRLYGSPTTVQDIFGEKESRGRSRFTI